MQAEEVEVRIGADGEVEIGVRGVKGKACLQLTRPLEEALGGDVTHRSYTSEYYASVEGRRHGAGPERGLRGRG